MLGFSGVNIKPQGLNPIEKEGGLSLYLDGSDRNTITIATGVSQWNDKSANQNNISQGTGSDQPALSTAGLNGVLSVLFDGSNDEMIGVDDSSLDLSTDDYTIIVIFEATVVNSAFHFILDKGSSNTTIDYLIGINTDNKFRSISGNNITNDLLSTTVVVQDTPVMQVVDSDLTNTTMTIFTDAASNGTLAIAAGNTNSEVLTVGDRTQGGQSFAGYIGTILLYNRVFTTAERQSIERFLANKYGIAV